MSYSWQSGRLPNPFRWIGQWVMSWAGVRVKSTVTFQCGDEKCKHEHKINIWHHPSEAAYDALQKEVQAAFDKLNK